MNGPFTDLSDQELACLYEALGGMLCSDSASHWMHDPEEAAGAGAGRGPSSVGQAPAPLARHDTIMPPAGPDRNLLFRLGRLLHAESERRGLETLATILPRDFEWRFASWEAFCEAICASYEHRPRRLHFAL